MYGLCGLGVVMPRNNDNDFAELPSGAPLRITSASSRAVTQLFNDDSVCPECNSGYVSSVPLDDGSDVFWRCDDCGAEWGKDGR